MENQSIATSISITQIYKIKVSVNGCDLASIDDEGNIAIDARFASAFGQELISRHLIAAVNGSFESKDLLLKFAASFDT